MIKRGSISVLCSFLLLSGVVFAQQVDKTGTWLYTEPGTGHTAEVSLFPDGRYKLTITTAQGSQSATGTYQIQGNVINIRLDNGEMQKMPYQLTGANTMSLTADGQTVSMSRQGGTNAAGGFSSPAFGKQTQPSQPGMGNPSQPGIGNQNQAMGSAGGAGSFVQHQHPQGFTFMAPDGWQTAQDQNVMIVTPSDAYMTNQGPAEAVLVYAEQATGITNAMDQQVGAYFNQQVKNVFPYLQPGGAEQTAKGAVYNYSGLSPLQVQMVGRLYVTINNGMAYVAFGLCPQERLAQRDGDFDFISSTMFPAETGGLQQGMGSSPGQQPNNYPQQNPTPGTNPGSPFGQPGGQAQNRADQNLYGLWTYSTESYYDGGMSATTRGLLLQQDGSYFMGSKVFVSGATTQTDFSGENDWTIEDRGTWTSQGNVLTFKSGTGATFQLQYQFGGNGIIFTDSQGQQYNCSKEQM